MIELRSVNKSFFSGSSDKIAALRNIALHISPQEFVIVIGSNGSGKSTLLNVIAGNVFPDSGEIFIENRTVNRLKDYERSKWIARIFQNPLTGTAADLSILDNFRLASLRTQNKLLKIGINEKFKKQVKEKIAMLNLGLENKLEQKMGLLSGGQRQALTLVMAVMDETKILLMDEPSAALDPKTALNLMENISNLVKTFRLTAMLVTHQMKDAVQYGNRLLLMQDGNIAKDLGAEEKSKFNVHDLHDWFG